MVDVARVVWASIPCILTVLSSCTTSDPIGTSLLDITGESRVTKLKATDFPWHYTLFEQHEAFAVNGLLQMPDVGQLFFFPGKGDPTSALGIAEGQSYKLIGQSEIPTPSNVEAVRMNLDAYQSWVVRTAVLDADIKNLEARLLNLSTNTQANQVFNALTSNLKANLDDLLQEQKETRSNRTKAQIRLRHSLKPGIIIARWRATDSGSASLSAAPTGNAAFNAKRAKTGFVILGGVRFVAIVYGEDFWSALNNLRPHEQSYVRQFGVTTYLIQASNLSYSAELDLTRVFQASGAVNVKDIARSLPRSVEVQAAIEQLANFGNQGTLGQITWRREPFCFVCGGDLPDLTTNPCERAIQRFLNAQHSWKSPVTANGLPNPSYQNWRTVVAKVAHLGWFPARCREPAGLFGKKVWEEYNEGRRIHGAPTCPVCSGVTNAYIPGFAQPRWTNHCDPLLMNSKP